MFTISVRVLSLRLCPNGCSGFSLWYVCFVVSVFIWYRRCCSVYGLCTFRPCQNGRPYICWPFRFWIVSFCCLAFIAHLLLPVNGDGPHTSLMYLFPPSPFPLYACLVPLFLFLFSFFSINSIFSIYFQPHLSTYPYFHLNIFSSQLLSMFHNVSLFILVSHLFCFS